MSTSRFSRCATEAKIRAAISPRRPAGSPSPDTRRRRRTRRSRRSRPARPPSGWRPACCPVPAPAAPPARTAPARPRRASRRRPAATRRSAAPTPSRSQSWSSTHAPPKRRESSISISPPCAAVDRLLRLQEPRDRGDQPRQRVAVHGVGAAEVVDHLRRGHPGDRVAFAVRQLQIAHRRPVPVASLRLPQVHPYIMTAKAPLVTATRPVSCAYTFSRYRHPPNPIPAETRRIKPENAYELRKSGRQSRPRRIHRNAARLVRRHGGSGRGCAGDCGPQTLTAATQPTATGLGRGIEQPLRTGPGCRRRCRGTTSPRRSRCPSRTALPSDHPRPVPPRCPPSWRHAG